MLKLHSQTKRKEIKKNSLYLHQLGNKKKHALFSHTLIEMTDLTIQSLKFQGRKAKAIYAYKATMNDEVCRLFYLYLLRF